MIDTLGKRAYGIPFVVVALLICLFSLMFYPMTHLELRGLPFAVVNLDEGTETPQGTMNAGDTVAEKLMSMGDSGEGSDGTAMPISWTERGSWDELNQAIDNGELYGAVVIPEDLTQSQLAAAQAVAAQATAAQAGGAAAAGANAVQADVPAVAAQAGAGAAQTAADSASPTLTVVLDYAKSPLVASQLQTQIASLFQQQGITASVDVRNAPGDSMSQSPLSGMMFQQLSILPLVLGAAIGSVLLRVISHRTAKPESSRWSIIGTQAVGAVALSLAVALLTWCAVLWGAGVELPFGTAVPFLWMAALCLMALFLGALNLSLPLGALVILLMMGLGTATGVLPAEGLPTFWQDWVNPWAPQHFIGEGVRAIALRGAGIANAGTTPLLVAGAIGLALLALAGALPRRRKETNRA